MNIIIKSILMQQMMEVVPEIDVVKRAEFVEASTIRIIEELRRREPRRRYRREDVIDRLLRLEAKQDESTYAIRMLLEQIGERLAFDSRCGPICRFRSEDVEPAISRLILTGGSSPLSSYEGQRQADRSLTRWLDNAVEIICIDPYIFKRTQEKDENAELTESRDYAYADQLLSILGTNKRLTYIYCGFSGGKSDKKVSRHIADRIEARSPELQLKSNFLVVEDLHDRVWLMKDRNNSWDARVIGTSRSGVGKRPTYMIDMSADDCREYRKYVAYLIKAAQANNQRPLNWRNLPN